MPGGRTRESWAEQRSLHPFFLVGVHAPELNLKRPGHCALGLSRIRARVLQAIAPPTLPGGCNIPGLKKGEERCYASGNEVCSVIQACGRLAEPEISYVPVPNHGIESINRLVRNSQRGTADGEVQKRRDDSITQAFCERLDHRAGDFGFIKCNCVPSHDPREALACRRKIGSLQSLQHRMSLIDQIASSKTTGGQPNLESHCD